MTYLRYTVTDGIAEICLNHAPANALTEPMLDELLACFEQARTDEAVKVLVLSSGVARRFCAGLDLIALDGRDAEDVRALVGKLYIQMTDAHHRLGKPTIAAVAGAARGGGMTLAISCDMVIAEHSASFGYPEIDVGLIPAIHFAHLPRIIGKHQAFDLLFTGRSFSAQQAHEYGLVSRLVDDGTARASAREIALTLASKPASALRLGRAAFLRESDPGYRDRVAAAVEHFCGVYATAEAREHVHAFVEKRRTAP